MSDKNYFVQLRKNWSIIIFVLTIIFSAGVVWAFTGRDFVEKKTFDVHVEAEVREMDQRFEAQKTWTEQKFEITDGKIDHVEEHLEGQKETLEEIKDLLK